MSHDDSWKIASTLPWSLTEAEIEFIAGADNGQEAGRHRDALHDVLDAQGGSFEDGQHWHPYEVVELVTHALRAGHEREFAACTLLVVNAVIGGFDSGTLLADKFRDRAGDYDALPAPLRDDVLAAYALAEELGFLHHD